MSWPVRHISRFIARPPADVVRFLGNPENLPKWASGVSSKIERQGEDWVSESPMGPIKFRFVPANDLGVLDHDVTLPDGTSFHNPMRVLPNAGGSELVFTVYRRDAMTEEEFERDAAAITADFETARRLLEETK